MGLKDRGEQGRPVRAAGDVVVPPSEAVERQWPAEAAPGIPQGGIFSGAPGFLTTRLDAVVNWARMNSLWPMPFGTACCAIEMMASAASRYDLARFGMERMSFSPRQADMLICAGRLPYKMAPVIRKIWEQMPQPKWAISMGACASTGGVFDVYSMVQGIDTLIPVDVYVPGCPPRPEGLIYGILMIQEKIRRSQPTRIAADWVHEEDLPQGTSYLSEETVDLITRPFGNSTNQNRSSGLFSTGAIVRPTDRMP
jgi:NADH-quinone oxidoreductase subunit B